MFSIYALNKLGVICNMIHPLSSEEELKYGMEITNTKYALVADIVYSKVKNIKDSLKLKRIVYSSVGESMDSLTKIGYKIKKLCQ